MMATSKATFASPDNLLSIPVYFPILAFLNACRDAPSEPLNRTSPPLGDVQIKTDSFTVAHRTYKQQYANIYFLRLAVLKDYCVNACAEKWIGMEIAGQKAKYVERV